MDRTIEYQEEYLVDKALSTVDICNTIRKKKKIHHRHSYSQNLQENKTPC